MEADGMNDGKQPINAVKHELSVKDRRILSVSGVKEMLGFDERSVRMQTSGGELLVEGDALRVKTLDPDRGQVTVEGRINALYYPEEELPRREGLWARLFK